MNYDAKGRTNEAFGGAEIYGSVRADSLANPDSHSERKHITKSCNAVYKTLRKWVTESPQAIWIDVGRRIAVDVGKRIEARI